MYVFILIRFIFLVMWWTTLGCANQNDPWIGRYGIHLMWLNAEDLKVEDTLIFPDKHKENVVNALTGWIEKNPEETTNIFLWYDSLYVNQDALSKTEEEFSFYFSQFSQAQLDRFRIWDIRQLDFVKEHPDLFTNVIPAYFQTDLLRFVIGKEAVSNSDSPIFCNTFLYADLNVTSENRDIIFDSTTIKFLNNYGIVLLRNDHGPGSHPSGGFFGFENKFMMIRLNADLNKAIEVGLIQLFLGYKEYIDEYIDTEFDDYLKSLPIKHERYRKLEQAVYNFLPNMFVLFHSFRKNRELFICDSYTGVIDKVEELSFRTLCSNWWDLSQSTLFYRDNGIAVDAKRIVRQTRDFYRGDSSYEFYEKTESLAIPLKRMTAPRSHFT